MAEPLKNYFDDRVPRAISVQIATVWPDFPADAFVQQVLVGYGELELMDRGRHIARTLGTYLPEAYPQALDLLLRSVADGAPAAEGDGGMASFLYLPHLCFVAEFGLDDFDRSMGALYILTQRFTAEFSIRPFIERYQSASLALLHTWATDPNPHIRRLVSEGSRPRLPWAGRLRSFLKDPAPVLALLERLKDDPEEFVRRSVANNLNDIGKDHPDTLLEVARRWMADASPARQALVRHALRSLVKEGNAHALEILGYGRSASVRLEDVRLPAEVPKGGKVTIEFNVRSTGLSVQAVLVDLRVHFVKRNGRTSPKVFKLKAVNLRPGEVASVRKSVSLADLTTRRHYPGRHSVEVLVNGRTEPLGAFVVTA
jgi:3-methyladenine DNA glycosylase AlkC